MVKAKSVRKSYKKESDIHILRKNVRHGLIIFILASILAVGILVYEFNQINTDNRSCAAGNIARFNSTIIANTTTCRFAQACNNAKGKLTPLVTNPNPALEKIYCNGKEPNPKLLNAYKYVIAPDCSVNLSSICPVAPPPTEAEKVACVKQGTVTFRRETKVTTEMKLVLTWSGNTCAYKWQCQKIKEHESLMMGVNGVKESTFCGGANPTPTL
jgi:hypothetical protein